MDIRKRLTYQFITIVALIILLASVAIYFFSAGHRQNDFYLRLKSKAENMAKLLIQVEEIDADLLRKMEIDNPLSLPEEMIIIYNFRNEVLYSSDEEALIKIDNQILDEVRLNEEVRFTQSPHEVLGFLYTDRYDRFVVIAAAIDIYGHRKLKNLRTILLVVFGSSIIVVFISGTVFSRKALKPIAKVIDQVNEISINNLDTRLRERPEQDEIGHLTSTFNNMLDRLETAFKLQKNFIANASHELRTPLTSITGQMEVILLKERTGEEYQQAIRSVLDDIKNLNILSNRLLMLAQTSAEISDADRKTMRADDVIWQVRTETLKRHPQYQIAVVFDDTIDEGEKLSIRGNEHLIKVAITNLVDNGCKYSDNQKVTVEIKHEPGHLVLQFIDEGIGIPEEDLNKIFEPFHRGKNAFSIKGHGIGLSLVHRIIKSHGGNIYINSCIDKGTIVAVHLPVNF